MSSTREIRPIDMQMVTEYLRANLSLDVKTESHYVGDMHGGDSLYKDSHTITLLLDGEEISSISL